MKRFILFFQVLTLLFLAASCSNKNTKDDKLVLTERIQYPVFIKCPYDEETDWWRENMEGPKREKFVNIILDAALSGKVKAYDYITDNPLSKEQVNAIFNKFDTVTFTRLNPPYDEYDTIINIKLERKDIHRITFLEEWYFDEVNFKMEKKVVGIAPAITMYADSSEILGYKPLFWIYLDEKYPLKK